MATEHFAELMRRKLAERRMSVQQLADASGVSINTIHAWIRGTQKPSIVTLAAVAVPLDVSASELMAAFMTPKEKADTIMVPEAVQAASAGPGSPVESESWPFRPSHDASDHEFVAVRVSGDCMEPEIFPGDVVIVDKTVLPGDGQPVVLIHEGEALVKIYRDRGGEVFLEAIKDLPIIKPNGETRIVGVVVEVRRKLRRYR